MKLGRLVVLCLTMVVITISISYATVVKAEEQEDEQQQIDVKEIKTSVKELLNEQLENVKNGEKELKTAQKKLDKAEKYMENITFTKAEKAKANSKETKKIIKEIKPLLKDVRKISDLTTFEEVNELLKLLKNEEEQVFYEQKKAKNQELKVRFKKLSKQLQKEEKRLEKISEKQKGFEEMRKKLKEKLNRINSSYNMSMSNRIGFTREELEYLLYNSKLVNEAKNYYGSSIRSKKRLEMIKALSQFIESASKTYKLNEPGYIGIMALETGRFTSRNCILKNNFGGLRGKSGYMSFSSKEEGITRTAYTIRRNMRRGNTLKSINRSYCPGNYGWTKMALSFVREIKSLKKYL